MQIEIKDTVIKNAKLQERDNGVKFFYLPETINNKQFSYSKGNDLPVGVIAKDGLRYGIFPLDERSARAMTEAQ